jgi:SAM-dependent methyltransferase
MEANNVNNKPLRIRSMADQVPNVCAGPFGALYDFYIERPWLMRAVGRVVWGIDASVLYASMGAIEEVAPGSTIVDVPCGGGVAFRALRPEQEVRYIAADLDPKMLRRACRRDLWQVELITADMAALPFADGEADLFLSYSGLHMVDDPAAAVAEIARCLKPRGRLVVTTFFSDCSRRARALFEIGRRSGHPIPPSREEVASWLAASGLEDATIGPQPGFAGFSARKGPAGQSPDAGSMSNG